VKKIVLVLLVAMLILLGVNPALVSAQSPGVYQLSQIEVTRSYPAGWVGSVGGLEPGTQNLGAGARSFRMGYDLTFQSGMAEYNYEGKGHASSEVTLTQVPTTLTAGQAATFSASMTGEWKNQGYAVDRDHTIRLSGDVGEQAMTVQAPPSGACNGSINSSKTVTVPDSAGAELVYTVGARINFGENWCDMNIRLVYSGGAAGVSSPPPATENPYITPPKIPGNTSNVDAEMSALVQTLLDDIHDRANGVGATGGMSEAEFQEYLLQMQTRIDRVKNQLDAVEATIQNYTR